MRVGLIGGTGHYTFGKGEPVEIETAFGPVVLSHRRVGRHDAFFAPRHGEGHTTPAHRVNHRAHVEAFRAARVDYLLATFNVGTLDETLDPGSWVVPDDVLDLGRPPESLHDEGTVHVDFTDPFCPHARAALLAAGPKGVRDGGVYASVAGPRFDSKAELRALARLGGNVVGMTGGREATLAREAGLCYGGLCFVANGPGDGQVLRAVTVQQGLAARRAKVNAWLEGAIARLDARKKCHCRARAAAGRLGAMVA